jgi:hypothetical protein
VADIASNIQTNANLVCDSDAVHRHVGGHPPPDTQARSVVWQINPVLINEWWRKRKSPGKHLAILVINLSG